MSTTTETVRKILAEFANLQNEKKTLKGNLSMSFRDAIRSLYPTLQRMRKRGFKTKETDEKLNEYGLYITPVTLAKYMNELGKKKKAKQDEVRKRE